MTHHYVSTACAHGQHRKCRALCKYCDTPCACTECTHEDLEDRPISRLTQAVQDFVNAIDDEAPVLLRSGAVVWETQILDDDDGDAAYKTSYASLDGTSMASTIGVLELGKTLALDDMVGGTDGEDD